MPSRSFFLSCGSVVNRSAGSTVLKRFSRSTSLAPKRRRISPLFLNSSISSSRTREAFSVDMNFFSERRSSSAAAPFSKRFFQSQNCMNMCVAVPASDAVCRSDDRNLGFGASAGIFFAKMRVGSTLAPSEAFSVSGASTDTVSFDGIRLR